MRFFLWILVILGIVGEAAVIVFVALNVGDTSAITLVPLALSVALWLLWGVCTLILILLIASLLRRLWINVRDIFGNIPAARLLALGVVAASFSATTYSLLAPLFALLTDFTIGVPEKLQSNWRGLNEICNLQSNSQFAFADCTRELLLNFTYAITSGFARAVQTLTQVRWTSVFLGIAMWVALGQLLSEAIRPAVASGRAQNSSWAAIVTRIGNVKTATWLNICLFVLIGFGGLLAISALIAIPVLSDAKPMTEQDLTKQGQRLDEIVRKADIEKEFAPELNESDDLKALWKSIDDEIKRIRGELDARNTAATTALASASADVSSNKPSIDPTTVRGESMPPDTVLRRVQEMFSNLAYLESFNKRTREDAPKFWSDFRLQFLGEIDAVRQYAFAALQRQSFAPGGINGAYVGEVETWLKEAVDNARRDAQSCRTRYESGPRDYANVLKYQLSEIREPMLFSYSIPTGIGGTRSLERCTIYPYGHGPNAGELTLGAFAFSAWLIKLNSMPLTLIAGMLGFGLIGAAGSSVIRDRGERAAGAPLVKDLPSVVVRGLSATVVVFLAVKSGLLIFTGGTSGQADPHVLLLTCLVASVFSEDVWDAMKKWVTEKMQGVSNGSAGLNAGGSSSSVVPAGGNLPIGGTKLAPAAPQSTVSATPTIVSSKARASSELGMSMPLGPGTL